MIDHYIASSLSLPPSQLLSKELTQQSGDVTSLFLLVLSFCTVQSPLLTVVCMYFARIPTLRLTIEAIIPVIRDPIMSSDLCLVPHSTT